MLIGTLLHVMGFADPHIAFFFNHSPSKLIVACEDDIFIVDVSSQSQQPFSGTPQNAWYRPHALALSENDTVMVAGDYWRP